MAMDPERFNKFKAALILTFAYGLGLGLLILVVRGLMGKWLWEYFG